MTQEEKAKAYDEALEVLKEKFADKEVCGLDKSVLQKLFPQLKESEDEKTWIINYLSNRILNSTIIAEKENLKKAIAWLEKQGKNNMGISEATKQKLEDNLHKALEKETPESFNKFLDEQGEQKSIEYPLCKTVKDKIDYYIVNHFTTDTVVKTDVNSIVKAMKEGVMIGMSEQKPAWSEEDERNLDWLMTVCERIHYKSDPQVAPDSALMLKDWLYSLKDRVQPKQEWSEEDEKMLKACTELVGSTICANYGEEDGVTIESCCNWLKSLRPQNWTKEDKERYISCLQRLSTGNPEQPETINSKWFKEHVYPQSIWKPSDEQLKALKEAVDEHFDIDGGALWHLYDDLKKLMEK